MGVFERLAGVIGNFIQIGGPSGPGFNNNSGALEAKNAANNALAIFRAATPVGDTDVVNKQYVDTVFNTKIVTAQSNGVSALQANTSTEHFTVVSTPGTGAAAAYIAGALLWDDGSGTGNVTIVSPVVGGEIVCTTALSGGTFTFSANQNYVWTGSAWLNIAPSVSGAVYTIAMAVGTSASQSSTSSIPANAYVLYAELTVSTPFSAGATIAIGQTGTTGLLQATADNVATLANQYGAAQTTTWGASTLPVLVTVGGAPAAGAGIVAVQYCLPLS
jgi:hypothetical protein